MPRAEPKLDSARARTRLSSTKIKFEALKLIGTSVKIVRCTRLGIECECEKFLRHSLGISANFTTHTHPYSVSTKISNTLDHKTNVGAKFF